LRLSSKFVPISARRRNLVDCAAAELIEGMRYVPGWYPRIGVLQGYCDIEYATERVRKVGRTTGYTEGRITATELDNVVVDMDSFLARFDDQVEVKGTSGPFSQGGDSGSLIIDDDDYGVGLLFAGSTSPALTFANQLTNVLDLLKVDLA
jgi:hypothetical protein